MRTPSIISTLLALTAFDAHAHVFTVHYVAPEDGWCEWLQTVGLGDVIALAAGDYEGGCVISQDGVAEDGEPLAIIPDGSGPVRIIGPPGRPVVTITGNYVRLGSLTLVPAAGQSAILGLGENLLIDNITFEGGAVGIDASRTAGGLSFIGNLFEDVPVPVVATCAEPCDRVRAVLRDNLFRSRAPHDGTAVDVTATFEVVLQDNVFEGAWRTAADIRGPLDAQGNLILGGERGMVVREGKLQNNIIVDVDTAIVNEGQVTLVANTLIARHLAFSAADVTAVGNAFVPGTPDHPSPCDDQPCWRDVDGGDLRPADGGALIGAGPGAVHTIRDFCRHSRREVNAAGALTHPEQAALYLQPVSKRSSNCFAEDYVDTRLDNRPPLEPDPFEPDPLEPGPGPDETTGCEGGALGGVVPLLMLLALRPVRHHLDFRDT